MEKKYKLIVPVVIIAIVILLIGFFIIFQEQESEENIIVSQSNSMLPGIKLGDELVYADVNDKDDITSWVEGKTIDYKMFGDYGDVIVYAPYGEKGDMIIHRVIFWVDLNENGTCTASDYDIFNTESITIEELGISNYKPSHSGFITKGDNNAIADQSSPQLCTEPVKAEWIVGKILKIES